MNRISHIEYAVYLLRSVSCGRRAVIAFLACCLLIPCMLFASASTNRAADLPESVTLEYCIARSMAAAEEGGVFDAELAFARADIRAARARSYPHVNVIPDMRYYSDNSEVDTAISGDLGEHFLEIPQNRLHRRIARRNATLARCRQDGLRARRRAEVVRTYADCLKAEKELELAEKECAAKETAEAAWSRMNPRSATLVEQQESARTALRAARAKTVHAELQCREMKRRLCELCDLSAGHDFRIEDMPDFEMPPVTLEDCLSWAAVNHNGLSAALHEIETAELMIDLARMGRLPTPGLSFGYSDRGQDEFDDTESGAYGSVFVRIPLWDAGETKADVERLRARREALSVEAETLRSDLEKNIASAFLALKQAFISLQSVRSDPEPDREFRSARIRFENGDMSRIAFEAAELNRARHAALLLYGKWDCFRAQADLLESIEATAEQLLAGLKQGPSQAEKE